MVVRKRRDLHPIADASRRGKFAPDERVSLQCVERFSKVNVVAGVFRKTDLDHVQQLEIVIGTMQFDGKAVQPDPVLKLDEIDRAIQEAGQLPREVRD